MGTKATREELGDIAVVWDHLFGMVKQGKRPANRVAKGIQRMIEGNFSILPLEFFNQFLLPLSAQFDRLVTLNRRVWDQALIREQLDEASELVEAGFDHTQRVDDLLTFFVNFGAVSENMRRWERAIFFDLNPDFKLEVPVVDDRAFGLSRPVVREYPLGIHLVRINLVAHWEPNEGRFVTDVREQALKSGEVLAQAETLAAYGLNPALLAHMDGENLPFVDIGGIECTHPDGMSLTSCPYLLCDVFGPRLSSHLGASFLRHGQGRTGHPPGVANSKCSMG